MRRSANEKEKKKKKKKRTGMCLAFVSGRRARRARVKNGGQLALAFASKGGGPIYLLRDMVSGNKKKRQRKKKKTESGTQGGKEAHPGEKGEGEEGEEGGKTHPKMWKRDRKSTRLNSSHAIPSRMPSSA